MASYFRTRRPRPTRDEEDDDEDDAIIENGEWYEVKELQKRAKDAITVEKDMEQSVVIMRGLIDYLDQSSIPPEKVLAMRVPVVAAQGEAVQDWPLLAIAFVWNKFGCVEVILDFLLNVQERRLEIMRECLRGTDDGRSVMQIAAGMTPLANEFNDVVVDKLYEIYWLIADAEDKEELDRDAVEAPYADYYHTLLHPGPPPEKGRQIDAFPARISIAVAAHGADLMGETFDTPRRTPRRRGAFGRLRPENATILFFGPGTCGTQAWGSWVGRNEFERAVWDATRPHDSNTFATMQQVQPRLRELYKQEWRQYHLENDDELQTIDADEHCRMVNPYLDRQYTYLRDGFLRIVQSFNSPYNDLVGKALFGPEMRRRMAKHHPDAAELVDEYFFTDQITDRGSIRSMRLSEIAEIVSMLGYKAMNVYDYCCRVVQSVDNRGMRISSHGTPTRRKSSALRVRDEETLEPRGFGGGGGKSVTTRTVRRRRERRRKSMRTRKKSSAAAKCTTTR